MGRKPSGKCHGIVTEFQIVWRVVTLLILLFVLMMLVYSVLRIILYTNNGYVRLSAIHSRVICSEQLCIVFT